ncbi:MAG: hypothetical protein Q4E07_00515 [Eubacteriales bacterium]|nr:hypothetical protein [Eubacteriales bacterium]
MVFPAGVSLLMPSLITLYNFIFCILASNALTQRPIFGGALFIAAQVAGLASKYIFDRSRREILGKKERIIIYTLTVICFLFSIALILFYPKQSALPSAWVLFAIVLATWLRSVTLNRLINSPITYKMSGVQRGIRTAELSTVFLIIVAIVLFSTQNNQTAWYLTGAYFINTLAEAVILSKSRGFYYEKTAVNADAVQKANTINAYKAFIRLLVLSVAALQITQILIFSFIATTADTVFFAFLVAILASFVIVQLVNFFIAQVKESDTNNTLLLGLALWIFSLIVFWQELKDQSQALRYLSLASCSAGILLSMAALSRLEKNMQEVLLFAIDKETLQQIKQTKPIVIAYASMFGQMLALIGLALLSFFEYDASLSTSSVLQPALILPALVLAIATGLAALRFPLTKNHLKKLHDYMLLTKNGETNAPLQKQLENVIVKVSRKRYGLNILSKFVSIFMRVQIVGEEKVPTNDGISNVFICNHGELYGPMCCYIYMPFPFRPWIADRMMDKSLTLQHIYEGTFMRQKWMPKSWQLPLAKFTAPIVNWAMHSAYGIPVYRDNPKLLIKTFRETAICMQAGDDILIFPENPADESRNNLYLRSGIGEFFTGFTLVAPIYYQKTGKRCRFIPVYADKQRRRLSFGDYVEYNPDNDSRDETERICKELRQRILDLAGGDSK